MARSTVGGQQAMARFGAFDTSVYKELLNILGSGDAQVLTGTSDVVSFPGTTILNGPAIDLLSLALPVAGPQPQGDDGKTIEIIDAAGKAHVLTTPANGINVTKHVATWGGTAGGNITLQAWNGTWLTVGTPNGVTIT